MGWVATVRYLYEWREFTLREQAERRSWGGRGLVDAGYRVLFFLYYSRWITRTLSHSFQFKCNEPHRYVSSYSFLSAFTSPTRASCSVTKSKALGCTESSMYTHVPFRNISSSLSSSLSLSVCVSVYIFHSPLSFSSALSRERSWSLFLAGTGPPSNPAQSRHFSPLLASTRTVAAAMAGK